ncbi:MAG: DUF1698 domain-containing protein [Pseudomonadales bacterium]|nr:MAG: DUF1698 domain-containing protein [Acidimicrobiales bacterium]RZV52624.1 MAG: DUF1698 domain-containing protein [Pseudomonadales bacterium]
MFGAPYSRSKRSSAQPMPDYRAGILDSEFGLKGRAVLEAGCFEGNHTVGLAQSGALVTAFDGRVENVVKTQVRCSFFAIKANIVYWNAETQKPGYIADRFDLLHHVGVLYHLSKPIAHLASLLPLIETGVLLDTHVADDMETQVDTFQGLEYRYANFREAGREPPFAGLTPSAQWIHSEDLLSTIRYFGFKNARIIEDRSEPNGKRVCIIASRN